MKIRSAAAAAVLVLLWARAHCQVIDDGVQVEDEAVDDTFDPDQYPPAKLSDILAKNPCKKGADYEVKDIPFRSELEYEEKTREIPSKDKELIRRWTSQLDSADQAAEFSKELMIKSEKTLWWMPVPASILPDLRQDAQPGDHPLFYMSFSGCVDGQPRISIEEFGTPYYDDLEEEASSYIT